MTHKKDTLLQLKFYIYERLLIRPEEQKLSLLNYPNVFYSDSCSLSALGVKNLGVFLLSPVSANNSVYNTNNDKTADTTVKSTSNNNKSNNNPNVKSTHMVQTNSTNTTTNNNVSSSFQEISSKTMLNESYQFNDDEASLPPLEPAHIKDEM